MPIMQRPLEPRSIARSSSPLPITLTEIPLLHIRNSPDSFSPLTSKYPGRSPLLSINCGRPSTPKPAIRVFIPEANESAVQPLRSDSPLFGGYYGHPGPTSTIGTSAAVPTGNITIRPTPVFESVTCVPRELPGFSKGVLDVKGLLDSLNELPLTWSDEHFEEQLSHLSPTMTPRDIPSRHHASSHSRINNASTTTTSTTTTTTTRTTTTTTTTGSTTTTAATTTAIATETETEPTAATTTTTTGAQDADAS